METTSATLLSRLRDLSDERAWGRFVELYTPLIYHWVRAMGLPTSDANDLLQDVFAKTVTKLPEFQYDPGHSFRAWLRTVTMNQCRDHLRRRAVVGQVIGSDQPATDPAPDAADFFSEREFHQSVARRALELMRAEFEPSTWKACWQSIVEERPVAEIADSLGMSLNAVYLAKSRVLRRLREEFSGLLDA